MMYSLAIRKSIDKLFSRLAKRNPARLKLVEKKIEQILVSPHHFKPLRVPMQHLRQVHVDESYVLVYSIDERNRLVVIEDFAHHDKIYKSR